MLNEPLNYIDPTGHAQTSPEGNSLTQVTEGLIDRALRVRQDVGRYPRIEELPPYQRAMLMSDPASASYYAEWYRGSARDESGEFALGLATFAAIAFKGPALIRAIAAAGSNACLGDGCRAEANAAQSLVDEVVSAGSRINPDAVLRIGRNTAGKVVWLENGNARSGAQHIMKKADQYEKLGIAKDKILDFIMAGATHGTRVGMQNTRPIYEYIFEGKLWRVAIDIGSNGYIVGANPTGSGVPIP